MLAACLPVCLLGQMLALNAPAAKLTQLCVVLFVVCMGSDLPGVTQAAAAPCRALPSRSSQVYTEPEISLSYLPQHGPSAPAHLYCQSFAVVLLSVKAMLVLCSSSEACYFLQRVSVP